MAPERASLGAIGSVMRSAVSDSWALLGQTTVAHCPAARWDRTTVTASPTTSSTCSNRLAIPPLRSIHFVHERAIRRGYLGLMNLLPRQGTLEDLARQSRQDRIGDDIVDHASARIRVVAERHDVVDGARVGDEFRAMILFDPLADAVELQAHDRGQHLARQRKIGKSDDASAQRGREHFKERWAQFG